MNRRCTQGVPYTEYCWAYVLTALILLWPAVNLMLTVHWQNVRTLNILRRLNVYHVCSWYEPLCTLRVFCVRPMLPLCVHCACSCCWPYVDFVFTSSWRCVWLMYTFCVHQDDLAIALYPPCRHLTATRCSLCGGIALMSMRCWLHAHRMFTACPPDVCLLACTFCPSCALITRTSYVSCVHVILILYAPMYIRISSCW